MKCAILLATVAVFHLVGCLEMEELMIANQKCLTEGGFTKEDLPMLNEEANRKAKCFFACASKEVKALENGQINLAVSTEIIKFYVDEDVIDKVDAVAADCLKQGTQEDECELLHEFRMCIKKNLR